MSIVSLAVKPINQHVLKYSCVRHFKTKNNWHQPVVTPLWAHACLRFSAGFVHNSSSFVMSSGSKWKRQELDLQARYEVVRSPLVSARKLADQFKCGKTQIQANLLKKDNILKDYEANVNSNMKQARGPQHEEIDKALLDWFRKAQSKNIPIIGASVTRKSYKNCRSSRSFRWGIQGFKRMARSF